MARATPTNFRCMTTTAVYQGQRAASDKKRVFILSRSAYAGSQRNAAAVWSGDVDPNWETFRRQIPAGLNYSVSGLPYWTTDIGGFVSANPDDPAYRELYIRWFQFGTFCPIFRAHGTRTTNQNEIWSYGPDAQKTLTAYDNLRYRLMPYIYSLAWKTTSEGYTIMRPLVMDFREDTRAQNIGDQFLFGPAILVNPVTEPGAATRRLYLPNAKWYDFWTGAAIQGGRTSTLHRRSIACRSTFAPAPSFRSVPTSNTPPKNPPIPSNFASIAARTAPSLSTKTKTTPTTTKKASTQRFPSHGTTARTLSPSATAQAHSPACSKNAPSASSLSLKITASAAA